LHLLGVAERARADARIILEGIKTEVFRQRTRESNYVVCQKQLNQGSRTETLPLPSFTGTVSKPFKAPGGITVQIPPSRGRRAAHPWSHRAPQGIRPDRDRQHP
jgi:hypothetical protein